MNAPHSPGRIVRTFKSGNSIALRLPRDMGFGEGEAVVIVTHDDGSFSLWKHDHAREVFMGLYGSMSPGFMAQGRGETGQDARDWTARQD